MIISILIICLSLLCISWAWAGITFGWNQWKISKLQYVEDNGGGRDPGDDDPRDPFGLDPTDKGDWWKYPPKDKTAA